MSEENVSLLNCNFSQKKIRITSPHSLLAIRLIGATLEDLRYLSLDEYIKKNISIQYLEKDLQQERYNHYEQNRLGLIKEAKKIREDLLKEDKYETAPQNSILISPKNNIEKLNYTSIKKNISENNLNTSTAILLEREKLHKLLLKQETKVKLQIDYECMIEENRRKNIEKMKKKEIKEEKRRKEKEKEILEKKEKEREKMLEKKKKRRRNDKRIRKNKKRRRNKREKKI